MARWVRLEIPAAIAARHGLPPEGFSGWGLLSSDGVHGTIVREAGGFSGVVRGCMIPRQQTLEEAKRYVELVSGEGP